MTENSATKCGWAGAAATDYPSACTHINAAETRDEETKEKVIMFRFLTSRVNNVTITRKKTNSSN